MVRFDPAFCPIATLLFPVVLLKSARLPFAVFLEPEIFDVRAINQFAELSLPVVLLKSA